MDKNSKKEMIKIVYFDETAATNYMVVKNGGQLDWTTKENKEKLAKVITEIDAQVGGKINLISIFKAVVSGNANANIEGSTSKLVESTLTNSILTDYIKMADEDKKIEKFSDGKVYIPDESITLYKIFSSYLNIVPEDKMPISIKGLNEALLGERGYYQMLIDNKQNNKTDIIRFNISAFKNNYSLADLPKMCLKYYGVKVGKCTKEQLKLSKEFEVNDSNKILNAKEVVSGEEDEIEDKCLDVYDIVLAGVIIDE